MLFKTLESHHFISNLKAFHALLSYSETEASLFNFWWRIILSQYSSSRIRGNSSLWCPGAGQTYTVQILVSLCLPWRINQHPAFCRVAGSPLSLCWMDLQSVHLCACLQVSTHHSAGSSRLEAANFTTSGPFYPLCIPRMALKLICKKLNCQPVAITG